MRALEREGEKRRGLSAHSPSPRAWHPNPSSRLYERSRPHEMPRGGARCAPGKFGGFTFIILKPRAEGYETEIVANFAVRGPINRLTCMWKTKHKIHLLCGSSRAMKRAHGGIQRRNSMALHREENKVPLRQSPKCKWIIARVVVGSEIATTKGNVTASWRQRNLRSGWRVRQYDLTTSLRQRRRRAISQWIGVILYGLRLGHAEGVPKVFKLRSVELPMKENNQICCWILMWEDWRKLEEVLDYRNVFISCLYFLSDAKSNAKFWWRNTLHGLSVSTFSRRGS